MESLPYNGMACGLDFNSNLESICKFWVSDEIKNLLFCNNISLEKKYPTLCEVSNLNYITSDIHGDMNSLLYILLKSGFAKFESKENLIKKVKINIGNVDYYVSIPNLKINELFFDKVSILGDLVDRGLFSKECLVLVSDIFNQINELNIKNDVFSYTVGNHEMFILIGSFYNIPSDNGFIGNDIDFLFFKFILLDMLKNNNLKFLIKFGENSIGSHALCIPKQFLLCFDELKKIIIKTNDNDNKIFNKYEKLLSGFKNIELFLKNDDCGCINNKNFNLKNFEILINELFTESIIDFVKFSNSNNSTSGNFFRNIVELFYNNLLNRTINFKMNYNRDELKKFSDLFQIIGHDAISDHLFLLKNNAVYIDCMQSHGYNLSNLSFPTFILFNGAEFLTSSFRKMDKKFGDYEYFNKFTCLPDIFIKNNFTNFNENSEINNIEINFLKDPTNFNRTIKNIGRNNLQIILEKFQKIENITYNMFDVMLKSKIEEPNIFENILNGYKIITEVDLKEYLDIVKNLNNHSLLDLFEISIKKVEFVKNINKETIDELVKNISSHQCCEKFMELTKKYFGKFFKNDINHQLQRRETINNNLNHVANLSRNNQNNNSNCNCMIL